MEKKYCTAVVLAGGSGKRMGTKVHKQYLMLKGYPVLYYSLKASFENWLIFVTSLFYSYDENMIFLHVNKQVCPLVMKKKN